MTQEKAILAQIQQLPEQLKSEIYFTSKKTTKEANKQLHFAIPPNRWLLR